MTRKTERCNADGRTLKPYNSFSDYLWNKYNCRVLKIPINAGLSCPNRDGSIGDSGCVFCSEDGSATPGMAETMSIPDQIERARGNFKRADSSTRYIAYFQAYTNTYAPLPLLKELYDRAVGQEGIIGLMIGTRPDCLPDEVLDLVASYARPGFELWLEIGMQSCHDTSLALLRRGHRHGDTVDALRRAAGRGIPVCVHLILGIPGETWDDMMQTAASIREVPVAGVKLHHLHVIRGTVLAEWHRDGRMKPLSREEYVSTLCDFIERLSPAILVHRLMGDREETSLVAPRWGLFKGTVHKAIEDEFRRRGTCQGFLAGRQVELP